MQTVRGHAIASVIGLIPLIAVTTLVVFTATSIPLRDLYPGLIAFFLLLIWRTFRDDRKWLKDLFDTKGDLTWRPFLFDLVPAFMGYQTPYTFVHCRRRNFFCGRRWRNASDVGSSFNG
jgi:hypothetical protein